MGLEASFQKLDEELAMLRSAVLEVHVNAAELRPVRGEVVLVDLFEASASDALGWLDEMLVENNAAVRAAALGPDIDLLRKALTACQERYNLVARHIQGELSGYDRIASLRRLARVRRGAWQSWAEGVEKAVERCHLPLFETNQALFACWRELVERAAASTISVRNTNVGQRVTLSAGEQPARERSFNDLVASNPGGEE
jgi:hypothetical protein